MRPSENLTDIRSPSEKIENHPLVLSVQPPHIWQLTPPTATPSLSPPATNTNSKLAADASPLVATLVISIRPDASDADILSITQFARDRCSPALKLGGGGLDPGTAELTVQVVRGEKGGEVKFWQAGPMSPPRDHGHAHSHSHAQEHGGHGHSH